MSTPVLAADPLLAHAQPLRHLGHRDAVSRQELASPGVGPDAPVSRVCCVCHSVIILLFRERVNWFIVPLTAV